MSARGGGAGGGSKRTFKPNLAAANKRSTEQEQNQVARGSGDGGGRGRGRGRGGRGRGGQRGNKQSSIIETQSVFSQGPAAQPNMSSSSGSAGGIASDNFTLSRTPSASRPAAAKHPKSESSSADATPAAQQDQPTVKIEREVIEDNVDVDNDELEQLLRDDFVAGGSGGAKDLPVTVVESASKGSGSRKQAPAANRKVIADSDSEDEQMDTQQQTGNAESLGAADVIRRMTQANACDSGDYTLVTLPVHFDQLLLPTTPSSSSAQPAAQDQPASAAAAGGETSAPAADTSVDESDASAAHCLSSVPGDCTLGRLQLLRSGAVVLRVGNRCFPIEPAVHVHCKQNVMSVETSGEPATGGSVSQLGNVTARLNVTVDAERMVDDYNRSRLQLS